METPRNKNMMETSKSLKNAFKCGFEPIKNENQIFENSSSTELKVQQVQSSCAQKDNIKCSINLPHNKDRNVDSIEYFQQQKNDQLIGKMIKHKETPSHLYSDIKFVDEQNMQQTSSKHRSAVSAIPLTFAYRNAHGEKLNYIVKPKISKKIGTVYYHKTSFEELNDFQSLNVSSNDTNSSFLNKSMHESVRKIDWLTGSKIFNEKVANDTIFEEHYDSRNSNEYLHKNSFSLNKSIFNPSKKIDFVQDDCLNSYKLLNEKISEEPKHLRKLLIADLDKNITEQDVRYYFDQYGQIEEYAIIRHPRTKMSKCLGYIVFQSASMVAKARASSPHKIDNKTLTLVVPKEDGCEPERFCKLFVGKLSIQTTEKDLLQHFKQWGKIVDCVIKRDSRTKKSKQIGFVIFSSSEMLINVLNVGPHVIHNKKIAVDLFKIFNCAENSRKLLIDNLNCGTSVESVVSYFKEFGHVERCCIQMDEITNKPKGSAYVIFQQACSIQEVKNSQPHIIDNYELMFYFPRIFNDEKDVSHGSKLKKSAVSKMSKCNQYPDTRNSNASLSFSSKMSEKALSHSSNYKKSAASKMVNERDISDILKRSQMFKSRNLDMKEYAGAGVNIFRGK